MNLCVYDVVWKWNLSQMEGRIITRRERSAKYCEQFIIKIAGSENNLARRGGDITQVTQLRVQYVRSSNERQGEYVFRISYFAADWFCQLIIIMEPQAWEESRNVFWWQINKINTPAAGGGISSTHSNLTTQKLIREKIISFHITNRIFIACVEVDEDFLWSQLEIISSRTSPGNHFPIHLRTGYEL